jgi:hypothetical protein
MNVFPSPIVQSRDRRGEDSERSYLIPNAWLTLA